MSKSKNPYEFLPPEQFWKSGVCDRGSEHYHSLWHSRFCFDKSTKFATAGSCFAQHISKWLRENGYRWLDPELSALAKTVRPTDGTRLDTFSFQVGNIYTAAMLKQWIFWALDISSPPKDTLLHNGIYYDPFFSHFSQNGYSKKSELYKARTATLESIRNVIINTDVFVFTLGLTEGWVNKAGHIYPSCPGISRGVYNKNKHIFVNHSFASIEQDLNETFDAMKHINPSIKFLLTVSPVPLTATASENHVLVATIYSKSTLRAVAGQLKNNRDDVDYFPSYEIISSFSEHGRHFDENLRSVTPSGVSFVMAHFANSILNEEEIKSQNKKLSFFENNKDIEDVLCDDVLLERWAEVNSTSNNIRVCLIGDSHMERLAKSLKSIGIENIGGMIMNGSAWHEGSFELEDSEIFVPLEGEIARENWKNTSHFFATSSIQNNRKRTVITNLCMHTHRTVPDFMNKYYAENKNLHYTEHSLTKYICSQFEKHIKIINRLLQEGYEVIVVTDPPTQAISENFRPFLSHFEYYDQLVSKILENEGCKVFNSRKNFCCPYFPKEYFSSTYYDGVLDYIHGSDLFYDSLAEAMYKKFSLARQ